MPDQPAQRGLVEFAVAKRRDEGQPQALQQALQISRLWFSHGSISSSGLPETGPIKNPRRGGGVSGSALAIRLSRATTSGPREGTFFRGRGCARTRDHVAMMVGTHRIVNPRTRDDKEMKGTGEENIW